MSAVLVRLLLGGLLAAVGLLAFEFGADSVGGSDSAGYLLQAQRWRAGEIRQPLPLTGLPVADHAWVQTPLGFRPAPGGDATVPIYPPGWPLVLAAVSAFGQDFAVRMAPAAAALLALVAMYALARAWQRPVAALAAVSAYASTTPFLFQALQPMSDVPALAAWLTAFAAATRPGQAGLVTCGAAVACAIAIRPNLAPLALSVAWMAWSSSAPAHRTRRALSALVPALATAIGYALWQRTLYGSVWQSGYGTASELFSASHVWPNLLRQLDWIGTVHGAPGLLLLAVGASGCASRATLPRPLLTAGLTVWLIHLAYLPFDDWTYLRFVLLPLAVLTLAATSVVDRLTTRIARPGVAAATFLALAAAVIATNADRATRLGVFEMHRAEARYRLAATFVRTHTPPDAVVLGAQHSAAVVTYAGRAVIRLDLLQPTDAVVLLDRLRADGRPVVSVLDDEERVDVSSRFGSIEALRLDWPPRARIGRPARTRIWFLDDRRAHRAGERYATTPVWPERR